MLDTINKHHCKQCCTNMQEERQTNLFRNIIQQHLPRKSLDITHFQQKTQTRKFLRNTKERFSFTKVTITVGKVPRAIFPASKTS